MYISVLITRVGDTPIKKVLDYNMFKNTHIQLQMGCIVWIQIRCRIQKVFLIHKYKNCIASN